MGYQLSCLYHIPLSHLANFVSKQHHFKPETNIAHLMSSTASSASQPLPAGRVVFLGSPSCVETVLSRLHDAAQEESAEFEVPFC